MTAQPDNQTQQQPAADEPVVPELTDGGPPSEPVGESLRHRLGRGLFGAWAELRFVSERPPSLLDHLAYARRGEWTEEIDGYARHLALVHAWVVAVPVSTLAYLAAWVSARPGRCWSFLWVTLLVTTALAQFPAVSWLIPAWADLTCWPPPFSWVF